MENQSWKLFGMKSCFDIKSLKRKNQLIWIIWSNSLKNGISLTSKGMKAPRKRIEGQDFILHFLGI